MWWSSLLPHPTLAYPIIDDMTNPGRAKTVVVGRLVEKASAGRSRLW